MPFHKRKAGSAALRVGRFSGQNHIYHITSCTFRRRQLFHHLDSGRAVVTAICDEERKGHVRSLAFVVMPDHLHWLMQIKTDRPMSIAVNNVKAFSAKRLNQRNCRSGRVWQKGFYDRAIRNDEDLVAIARYIIANPLRAGIVRNIGSYPLWDSVWL